MTEEYKKQLIDYTTGLLNNENPNPQDFDILDIDFKQYKDSFSEFFEELNQNARALRITGILEDEDYDVSILYGGFLYGTTSTPGIRGRGFLIYLDKNNNVIDFLFNDKHGNALKGFHKLYIDKDSNRVYGVLGHPTVSPVGFDEPNYFCYMNNLLLPNRNGEYEVSITKSYDLDENDISIKEIVKQPELSKYLMIGTNAVTLSDIRIIQYTVNVGTADEIKKWNAVPEYGTYGGYFWNTTNLLGYYIWYTGDTPHFKIIFGGLNYDTEITIFNGKYYALAEDNGDDVSYTRLNQIDDIVPNDSSTWNLSNYQLEVLGINENNIYFVVVYENITNAGQTYYFQTRIHQFNGSTITTLYSSPYITTTPENWKNHDCYYYNFYRDTDGTIYLVKYYVDYNNSLVYTGLLNFTKYYNDIGGNNWYNIESKEYTGADKIYSNFTIMQRSYNISKIYNIVGDISTLIFIQSNLSGYIMTITNLFNLDGYNGTPYKGVDYFVPKLANLYHNNELLFSRNIYNISIQNNMTMSSVEIPNNYLNDLIINKNDLIGKTGGILNSKLDEWTKNIYEIVDLNFLNTINVIDEDTNIQYPLGANKINGSISAGTETNYNNTKCQKYRINYADGTNQINTIAWQSINDLNKRTTFTIYVDKEIKNIDLISNDESTIYMTLSGEFEIGSYYTIKQKVRIGNRPEPVDLQYNNENVLYNNEQVQVIV